MAKLLVPAVAAGSALALVATVGVATALQKNDVALTVDGATTNIAVREKTVGDVLDLEGIELSEHDVVLPAADTRVSDDMEITVLVARPLNLNVDGSEREVWTTAKTVQEALGYLDLDAADSKLSASRSAAIGRDGLSVEIVTAKDVTLVAGGEETAVRLAGTVGDVLTDAGITPDDDDLLAPAADEPLADGMEITYTDVEVKTKDVDQDIPFTKTSRDSNKMNKGETKVTTQGVDGVKRETYTEVYHDGALHSSELTGETVVKEPVTQVTTVGTYVAPKPKPAPEQSSSSSSSSSGSNSSGSGSSGSQESTPPSSGKALDLSRAAMWDRIARCESTNRWNINTGNGYYGGLQFNLATWRSVNGQDFAAYPHQASREEQITVANRLYAKRGLQPWGCRHAA